MAIGISHRSTVTGWGCSEYHCRGEARAPPGQYDKNTKDRGVGGRIEAGVWQDGGDDTWSKGGCRARQADKRKTGR
jgi:hypothetical protein